MNLAAMEDERIAHSWARSARRVLQQYERDKPRPRISLRAIYPAPFRLAIGHSGPHDFEAGARSD
jgi:hypothetical protein